MIEQLTDTQIKGKLKNFISNINARKKRRLIELDLRQLHNITLSIISKTTNTETLDSEILNIMLNNVLIFNTTDSILLNTEANINDLILKGVIENKKFFLPTGK